MTLIILLFLLGILFIAVEVIVPGGIGGPPHIAWARGVVCSYMGHGAGAAPYRLTIAAPRARLAHPHVPISPCTARYLPSLRGKTPRVHGCRLAHGYLPFGAFPAPSESPYKRIMVGGLTLAKHKEYRDECPY